MQKLYITKALSDQLLWGTMREVIEMNIAIMEQTNIQEHHTNAIRSNKMYTALSLLIYCEHHYVLLPIWPRCIDDNIFLAGRRPFLPSWQNLSGVPEWIMPCDTIRLRCDFIDRKFCSLFPFANNYRTMLRVQANSFRTQ